MWDKGKKSTTAMKKQKKIVTDAKEKMKKLYGKTEDHDEQIITDEELSKKIVSSGGIVDFIDLVMKFYSPSKRHATLSFIHALMYGGVHGVLKYGTNVIDKARQIKGLYKKDLYK